MSVQDQDENKENYTPPKATLAEESSVCPEGKGANDPIFPVAGGDAQADLPVLNLEEMDEDQQVEQAIAASLRDQVIIIIKTVQVMN